VPLISPSSWPGAPFWHANGHLQTLIPGIFRKVRGLRYTRERIETPDLDFLDLDWLKQGAEQLVIVTHGLEGASDRSYAAGTAALFYQQGWDALAWNCRSCSGEMNRAFRMYHHGDTEDISTVVHHALQSKKYQKICLVGFSMGGNITMKYLGASPEKVPSAIKAAVAFSAPTDLQEAADVLDRWDNILYKTRFLRALSAKIREKDRRFPGKLNIQQLKSVRRWRDFDEWFSAPICGYRDAADFYQQASAKHFLQGIQIPTLLVNALNDPILTPACIPFEIAENHPYLYLELPAGGGHCGFRSKGKSVYSWAEHRALEFCEQF
jgi:predicted alpha/beta-fold hydrolase